MSKLVLILHCVGVIYEDDTFNPEILEKPEANVVEDVNTAKFEILHRMELKLELVVLIIIQLGLQI